MRPATRRLALGTLLCLGGCPGDELRDRTLRLRELVRQARNVGAYRCAPAELAQAEAHLEFASSELDDGRYYSARRQAQLAEAEARRAIAQSPPDRCNPAPDSDQDGIGHDGGANDAQPPDGSVSDGGLPEARDLGSSQPIDDHLSGRGRENNRRTEFIITSQ